MDKLLLIDKDGTLIHPTHGKFVDVPWHQAPIPGMAQKLDRYRADGWKICIISNQGGVQAGHKSLNDAFLEFRFALELFPQIEEAYFCPDFEGLECWQVWDSCGEEHRIQHRNESVVVPFGVDAISVDGYKSIVADPACSYRKPAPGMLRLAIDIHAPEQTLYVGDRPEDEAAATAAGIPFIWAHEFTTNP